MGSVTEDALLKNLLLLEDAVLLRQAAMAAGQHALTELQRYHRERKEFYEAASVTYAGILVLGFYAVRDGHESFSIEEALALLEQSEPQTLQSQQLQYDLLLMLSRSDFLRQTPEERARYKSRMKELAADSSGIRSDAFGIVHTDLVPKWSLLTGYSVKAYDPPQRGVSSETLAEAFVLIRDEILPQIQLACAQAVGARRECLRMNPLFCCVAFVLNHAPTAELWQPVQDSYFGAECEQLIEMVSLYSFRRHSSIAKSVGFRYDWVSRPQAFHLHLS